MDIGIRNCIPAARQARDERTIVAITVDPNFATKKGWSEQRTFVVTNKMFEAFEYDLHSSTTEHERRHAVDEFVRRAAASEAA